MKLLVLLPFLGLIQASPFNHEQQVPLGTHEGFSLDLEAPRLIQLGESQAPVWMSEREKVWFRRLARSLEYLIGS